MYGDRRSIALASPASENAAGYILRNTSNMSDNVRHRYIGIREHIGNRSRHGQRDGPKTNVPIISRRIVYDSDSEFGSLQDISDD